MQEVLAATRIFDGQRILSGHAVVVEGQRITALLPLAEAPKPTRLLDGLLVPAFLDLQVNGGGGVLLTGDTDLEGLRQICAAHRGLGSAGVMPTLITETAEGTARVIEVGIAAAKMGVAGFLGLHLEGPHLDPRRKGAHPADLIRPMEAEDLARLCAAAEDLPALIITLAPEAVTPEQIRALRVAGAVVSLGHSDCSYEEAQAGFEAGAICVTHVYNAMSQLGHRSPGLVGAVLSGQSYGGLIADGIHVHPAAMKTLLAARREGIFLVSDCMSFAGTDLTEMVLHGRRVLRHDGRLTLEDGTLAGADLTLCDAVRYLVRELGQPEERALAMASAIPAKVIGLGEEYGAIASGMRAEMLLLDVDFALVERLGFEG